MRIQDATDELIELRTPLAELLDQEVQVTVAQSVAKFPPPMREMFALRYADGLSCAAIAQLMGVPEAAIRKRFSRALRELRSSIVGEVLMISVGHGDSVPQQEVLMPMLEQAGASQARVRIKHTAAGDVLVVQLWGEKLPDDLADRVRSTFPSAQVSERPLVGHLHGTLLDKLRYELLELSDPQKIEQLRANLVKELAAQGENGTVDISVSDVNGRPTHILSHAGEGPGVTSNLDFYPTRDWVAIVLENYDLQPFGLIPDVCPLVKLERQLITASR